MREGRTGSLHSEETVGAGQLHVSGTLVPVVYDWPDSLTGAPLYDSVRNLTKHTLLSYY